MSGGELAVVLASVAVVVAVAVLGAIGVSLSRALRDLRRLLVEIRRDLLPAVQRIEEASGQVTGEVQRVGGLLDVAERVSERAEALSRVTYRALIEPVNAVAALFRRGTPPDPQGSATTEPVVTGWGGKAAAGAPRPPRRLPWTRRLTVYLLRSGYRSAAARIVSRLAGAQASRAGTATTGPACPSPTTSPATTPAEAERPAGGPSRAVAPGTGRGSAPGTGRGSAPGTGRGASASGTTGLTLGRQLLEAAREVTNEISTVMEEGRGALRSDRKTDRRPE